MPALLGVSRSGYDDWHRRRPTPRQQEDARLADELEAEFVETRRNCGRVRLTYELQARGHACGQRRARRLMRRRHPALVFDYLEVFDNRARRHSALGCKSPVDFEQSLH